MNRKKHFFGIEFVLKVILITNLIYLTNKIKYIGGRTNLESQISCPPPTSYSNLKTYESEEENKIKWV